jgi:hypothetical protein
MRVTDQSAYFALAEVSFAVVLVMDDDRCSWGAKTVWNQEIGRNSFAVGAGIADEPALIVRVVLDTVALQTGFATRRA